MNTTATQPSTTPELLTENQASTNHSFFSMLKPLHTSTIPTFTELLAEYQASVNKPVGVANLTSQDLTDVETGDRKGREGLPLSGDGLNPSSTRRHADDPEAPNTRRVDEGLAPSRPLRSPVPTHDFLSSNTPANPFAIYQTNLANASPQPVRWLWQKRLPLAGITLLDGDHGLGKSLLTLQLAAHVSSGTSMPDGSTTIQGGVVIVSSHTDATTTQLQLLTALGADLSRIEILSYIQKPASESRAGSSRPFSIPEDFTRLFQAIKRVNARLIILDPFISLLSRKSRCTDQRLGHLLAELNQYLIEHNVACLITRNCHAKGGHARPTVLERSDHFATIAVSRLLLAPDPIQPDRLLLSHVTNRHAALTPTLTLQIQPQPDNPDLPHITILGTHSLKAKDLLNSRPDTLHRQLLTHHLLQLITAATDSIPVANLYSLSPHSSAFQIQRSLSDLLHMGQIQRPTRGIYTPAVISPIPQPATNLDTTAARSPISPPPNNLNTPATISSFSQSANDLNTTATISPIPQLANNLNTPATISTISPPPNDLNITAARSPISPPPNNLNTTAARSPIPPPTNDLNTSAAISSFSQSANDLNTPATISTISPPPNNLDTTAARSSFSQSASSFKTSTVITLKPKAPKRPHKGRSKHRNTKKRH